VLAGLAAIVMAGATARADEKPFTSPFPTARPAPVAPDAPVDLTGSGPPPDAAFGAYQRGYVITALREAEKRIAANSKDAAAMTLIGEIYRDGMAVKLDVAEASRWYRLASELGDKQAQFQLGVLMLDGADGVPKDREAAKAQFRKAAAQGLPGALYNLAVLALEGDDQNKPDFAKAADYFRRAAEAGDGNAAYSYGVLLRQGKGAPLDIAQSAQWLKRAADDGIIAGQVEYAIMLFNGVGVQRDEAGAAKIFILAAARRNPIAQNRLAHLYLTGRGVPRDLVQAAVWHGLAKNAGIEDKELDEATAHLTPDELAKVRDLTRRELEF
jgi:TPR repeat protein